MEEWLLETEALSKTFGQQKAVNEVSIHLKKGSIYGLIGRNGSGKTTIMKMILGLMQKTSGDIFLFGKKMDRYEKTIFSRIGSLIEAPGFYPNLTGTENLIYFAKLRGPVQKDAIQHALDIVGLPYQDSKTFATYSLGMKQRLGIANAIMHQPELLILDEPTNGLDPIGIVEIRELMKKLRDEHETTILISSHQLSEIERLVDHIGIIHDGVLVEECAYRELLKDSIYMHVSDVEKALHILQEQFGIEEWTVEKNRIIIHDADYDRAVLNRALIEAGVDVSALYVKNSRLEDYFSRIAGGEDSEGHHRS